VSEREFQEGIAVLLHGEAMENVSEGGRMMARLLAWAVERGCLLCEETKVQTLACYVAGKDVHPKIREGSRLPYALCERHGEDPDPEACEAAILAAVEVDGVEVV
jgi:hypothetical protein